VPLLEELALELEGVLAQAVDEAVISEVRLVLIRI